MTVDSSQYDIAIIGLACRFPDATTPQEFWNLLAEGREAITRFDKEDLLNEGLDEALINDPHFIPRSGYVKNADMFDAEFFGFSRSEAEITDPQFRVFLECAWEALEDAGCIPDTFDGKIGAFVGSGMSLYASRDMKSYFLHNIYPHKNLIDNFEHPQLILGNNREYLPTRVSYKLNLKGPSINIQTACSTSLVAAHMACQSLFSGECDAAIVGASAFHAPLKSGYLYKEGTFFSADGHCKVFDENSDGIVGGNGAGVVILKRLEDAQKSGDCIRAVIKASAINNDGNAKVSYTAPSFEGQVDVIKVAQSLTNIPTESITYVEAHGTGTKMGDPIEVAALTRVFQEKTNRKNYCALGSVKANIGHLDTAAGIASLIKLVLCLEKKQLPPQINFQKANPNLNLEASPFYINQSLKDWESTDYPCTAGLSSFGAGGTNAHFILQEYRESPQFEKNSHTPSAHILTLSAKSKNALDELIKKYKSTLSSMDPSFSFSNICYTTNIGRQHFKHRRSFIAHSIDELYTSLGHSQEDQKPTPSHKVAFLFTGQGAQYVEMGKDLYEEHPVYREQLNHCLAVLAKHLPESPREILFNLKNSDAINNTLYAQPLLFAVEYSLAKLWLSWDIFPHVLMGHSLGEYVAACLAGVLSLEDALELVATRAKLMSSLPSGGSMLTVFSTCQTVETFIKDETDLSIAAINGPSSVVISGTKEACDRVAIKMEEAGIDLRPLRVSHAFHSHLMEPIFNDFREVASKITYHSSKFPIVSNLTGEVLKDGKINADYWVKHLRNTVEFEKGMYTLEKMGANTYLEIGPKPILISLGQQCLPDSSFVWLGSMNYKQNSWTQILNSLKKLYEGGKEINWNAIHAPFSYSKCSLPTYAFQQERYYIDPPQTVITQDSLSLFQRTWKEKTFGSGIEDNGFKNVLIFGLKNELTWKLKSLLETRGKKVIVVTPNNDSQIMDTSGESWSLHPNEKADYLSVLEKAQEQFKDHQFATIFLWGTQLDTLETMDYIDIYENLIFLSQAMLELDIIKSESLFIVTHNATMTGFKNQNMSPLQAPLWSFARALNVEMNQKICYCIDTNSSPLTKDLELLVDSILSNESNEEISIRDGKAYVSQIQPQSSTKKQEELSLYPDASYLITGGLGSIGLELAEWLCNKGVNNLILVGRSQPSLKAQDTINALEKNGRHVHIFQGDIANEEDSLALASFIHNLGFPLKGVIHAAGTLDDGSLLSLNRQKLWKVMAPKIQGTLNLQSIVKTMNLDFFICFSSIASFIGSKGQINYAMANGFLDGFMELRREHNNPGLSIQWGPWGEVGMASNMDKHLQEYNLSQISNRAGLNFIEKCFMNDICENVAVIPIKNSNQQYDHSGTFSFSKSIWRPSSKQNEIEEKSSSVMPLNIPSSRKKMLKFVQDTVSQVLGGTSVSKDEEDLGFHDLGVDSIMALQLREKLSSALGIKLSATLIYKHPTLGQLTDFLLEELPSLKVKNEQNSNAKKRESSLEELAQELERELQCSVA